MQIPKVKKDKDDLTIIFRFLGSVRVKADRKTLVKLTIDIFVRLMLQNTS
jgi:hypothetical protein